MWHSVVFQLILIGGGTLVLGGLTRNYTRTPCAGDVISLTCTVPGTLLGWDFTDLSRTIQVDVTNIASFQQDQYMVAPVMVNSINITSSLSFSAVEGVTIGCYALGQPMTREDLTILTAAIPSPPTSFSDSILRSSANEVSISVQWDSPTETGGRDDLTYIVTILPPAQLSATVLTSTSVTVTAQYNMDYTVSVVAANCAGNSTTAEYNFRIGGCPVLIDPMNGVFGPVSNSLPGSTVTIQCDAGYVSAATMVTCEGTLMWSPDPEAIQCLSTTEPPPTTPPQVRCIPLSSPQNGNISDQAIPAIPGTQVTFQCNDRLFPEGVMTAVCLATGQWDKNPVKIVCRNESISCVLPAPPLNGTLLNINSQDTNPTEGSIITFRCDPGFSPVGAGAVIVTCNNSGLWDPDPALLECIYIFPPPTLSTEEAISVSVVVTAVVFIVIGFLAGLLVTHICSCKKAVYSPAVKGQANVRPTVPAGPVYEEVSPKEEIELNTNQAYGPVGL